MNFVHSLLKDRVAQGEKADERTVTHVATALRDVAATRIEVRVLDAVQVLTVDRMVHREKETATGMPILDVEPTSNDATALRAADRMRIEVIEIEITAGRVLALLKVAVGLRLHNEVEMVDRLFENIVDAVTEIQAAERADVTVEEPTHAVDQVALRGQVAGLRAVVVRTSRTADAGRVVLRGRTAGLRAAVARASRSVVADRVVLRGRVTGRRVVVDPASHNEVAVRVVLRRRILDLADRIEPKAMLVEVRIDEVQVQDVDRSVVDREDRKDDRETEMETDLIPARMQIEGQVVVLVKVDALLALHRAVDVPAIGVAMQIEVGRNATAQLDRKSTNHRLKLRSHRHRLRSIVASQWLSMKLWLMSSRKSPRRLRRIRR